MAEKTKENNIDFKMRISDVNMESDGNDELVNTEEQEQDVTDSDDDDVIQYSSDVVFQSFVHGDKTGYFHIFKS